MASQAVDRRGDRAAPARSGELPARQVYREAAVVWFASLGLAATLSLLPALWDANGPAGVWSRLWPRPETQLDWDPFGMLLGLVGLPITLFVSSVLAGLSARPNAWQEAAADTALDLLFGSSLIAAVGSWLLVPTISQRILPLAGVTLCAAASFACCSLMVFSRSQRMLTQRHERLQQELARLEAIRNSLASGSPGRPRGIFWIVVWWALGVVIPAALVLYGFDANRSPAGLAVSVAALLASLVSMLVFFHLILRPSRARGRRLTPAAVVAVLLIHLPVVLRFGAALWTPAGAGESARPWPVEAGVRGGFVVFIALLELLAHFALRNGDPWPRTRRTAVVVGLWGVGAVAWSVLLLLSWALSNDPAQWPEPVQWWQLGSLAALAPASAIAAWWALRDRLRYSRLAAVERSRQVTVRARDGVEARLRGFVVTAATTPADASARPDQGTVRLPGAARERAAVQTPTARSAVPLIAVAVLAAGTAAAVTRWLTRSPNAQ